MIGQDLRHAIRFLRRSPGFTAVAVFTVALGIGANTALFSVLDAVVLKSLPVRDPDRFVLLSLRNARGDRVIGFSYPLFSEFRAHNQSLTGMLAATWGVDRMPFRMPPSNETEAAMVTMVWRLSQRSTKTPARGPTTICGRVAARTTGIRG